MSSDQCSAHGKKLQEEVEAALKVRDDFLVIVAHEFKTPLSVIIGYAQLIQSRTPDLSSDTLDALRIVLSQAGEIDNMLNTLLDASRACAGSLVLRMDDGDIMATTGKVISDMQISTYRHVIELSCSEGNDTIPLRFDAQRFETALRNVISNAIKYTPNGGTIKVSADRVTELGQDYLTLTVTDRGIGVFEDDIPFVFDRYFRGKNGGKTLNTQVSGLGVGLFVTKEIVRLHGGTISLYSDGIFRGTTVIVRIPL